MREESLNVQGLQVGYKIAGEGPALLILHGWGSSSGKWERIASEITKQGFRVYAIDLPGFGASSPPDAVWGIKEYAFLVLAFMDAIGESKVIIVGHSVGGQIALQLALFSPSRVEKLILLAPAAVRRGPGLREHFLKVLSKILGVLLYVAPVNVRTNIKRIGYKMLQHPDYIKTYGIMREIFQKVIREDLTAMFPQVAVPTFLIWGGEDRITPLKDARLMEQTILGSQLSIVPESGHNLHVDVPQELTELIISLAK
ncbi:MAG: alpha/beta hydrolase [bacterium]|nr:alpha/beta hydrolase [bacterium]